MIYTVWEATDTYTAVITEDRTYDVLYDKWTGDWVVSCEDNEQVQDDWMVDRESAVQYALYRAGVIEDTNYNRAPERC